MADVIELLSALIAVPSVNPDQAVAGDPHANEGRMARALKNYFDTLDPSEVFIDPVGPDRDNIYAVWRVPGSSVWRCVDVHIDTVAVKHCTGDPFQAFVDEDNRLHGRGSCDTKATLALSISVLRELQHSHEALTANLIVAGTVGEETTSPGAKRFRAWLEDRNIVVDELLVAEPTLCRPINGHKGVCRLQFDFEGLAAHTSQPHLGHNALLVAASVIMAFETEHQRLKARGSLLGAPTLVVTLCSGGIATNIIPPHATLSIDRRVVVGEDPNVVGDDLIQLAREAAAAVDPAVQLVVQDLHKSNAFYQCPEVSFIQKLSNWAGVAPGTAPYGTNASDYAETMYRACVIMGPGSIDQAHQADEWIQVEELHRFRAILKRWWTE